MIWQDIVFFVGQLLFTAALVPSLMSKTQKPHRFTCGMTGVTLLVFSYAFLTLGLYGSCFATVLCGFMWIALGLQNRALTEYKIDMDVLTAHAEVCELFAMNHGVAGDVTHEEVDAVHEGLTRILSEVAASARSR
jgi:hypothetical protein